MFKLAAVVGRPIKIDQATKNKDRLNYARVMVEITLNQSLPNQFQFLNEHNQPVEQDLEYE